MEDSSFDSLASSVSDSLAKSDGDGVRLRLVRQFLMDKERRDSEAVRRLLAMAIVRRVTCGGTH